MQPISHIGRYPNATVATLLLEETGPDVGHIEEKIKGFRDEGSFNLNLREREWATIETVLEFASSDLGRVRSVADVGCGGREPENGALQQGTEYHRFDIYDGNLEFEPLPAQASSSDLVLELALIEHWHNPDNFLRETMRALRPGGMLIPQKPENRAAVFA